MLQSEEIEQLRAKLAQQRNILASQLALQTNEQAIASTRRAIADCKEALRRKGIEVNDESADQAPAVHNQQTVSGNAHIGVLVGGDALGYISYHTHHYHQKREPIDQTAALALLADLPIDQVPLPSYDLPAGSRISRLHSKHFVGREQDLLALAAQLKAGGVSVISTGIGGMGKSTLASEFIYRYGRYFAGGVYWLSFADLHAIEGEIAACGGFDAMQVYHESEQISLQERCARVQSAWNQPIPRLLIFDNWDHVGERKARELLGRYLPKAGGCRVLITSRNSQWPSEFALRPMPLGLLTRGESITLLRKYRSDISDTDADADAIARELGDLPLALTLAGSFLETYQTNPLGSPQTYLSNLRKKKLDHRSMKDGERELRATFALSYERLQAEEEVDTLAIALLAGASYFAPNEAIFNQLLESTLGELDPEDEEQALLRTDALKRLLELGLLEQVDQSSVRMHPLIAYYAQETIEDTTAQEHVEWALITHANFYIEQTLPRSLLPIVRHLHYSYQANEAQMVEGNENLRYAELALALGSVEQELANYSVAQPLLEKGLSIVERLLGEKHLTTVISLTKLAFFYKYRGRYSDAEALYLRALTISLQLEENSLYTSQLQNNLAELYRAQDRLEEAAPLYFHALKTLEEFFGYHHRLIATALNNLANLYRTIGRFEDAEALHLRAVEIDERECGKEHLDTAISLNNLAELYRMQGRYEEAEPLYIRSLFIREQEVDKNHPYIATALNNLAELYRMQGRYEEAEPLYLRALSINERVFGNKHPETLTSLNNLALLYQYQKRYKEAEPLFEHIISIYEKSSDKNKHHMLVSLNNLAALYQTQDRLVDARRLYQQALTISERELPLYDINIVGNMHNLGSIYMQEGSYGDAELLFQRALLISEQFFRLDHPYVEITRNALILCQRLALQLEEAEKAVNQALANPRIDRILVVRWLDRIAQQIKQNEQENHFRHRLASQLRGLAAKLVDPEEQALLIEKLQRAEAQLEAALQGNDPEISATLYEKLIVVADAYAGGAYVLPIHAEFANALRKLAAKLQGAPEE